jgi:hypothetical protein
MFLRSLRPAEFGAARIVLWLLTLLAIAAAVLELGVWSHQETHVGPFLSVPGTHALYLTVGAGSPLPCCFESRSDTMAAPSQSGLRLWINGERVTPPHAMHEDIRNGATAGFSYWDGVVVFSLPSGVRNNAKTSITVRYPVLPRGYSTAILIFASICLWLLLYPRAMVRAPYVMLRSFAWLALAASSIYIAGSLWALIEGWALPTTALIRSWPLADWLARQEPHFGFALLVCSAAGAVATWIAVGIPGGAAVVQQEKVALLRFFRLWGYLIVTCALVFSISAMWAGIMRPGDFNAASIGGLIPFSDAAGYVVSASDQAKTGVWSGGSLRRPLGAAFRTVLLFSSGYSYSSMLLLQACLLSAVGCFAAWTVAHWRGLWSGVAFLALTYINVRNFLPTALTEPPGLFWALFSIPFFIDALRYRSLPNALLALSATTLALMTRMGAMLTVPALVIWIAWQFGKNWKQKATAGVAAVLVVAAIVSVSLMLAWTYGPKSAMTNQGANGTLTSQLAFHACGLAIGTTWDGCPKRVEKEGRKLPASEADRTRFLYEMAWQNVTAHPEVLLHRLLATSYDFLRDLPDRPFIGYSEPAPMPVSAKTFVTLISIAGVIFALARRRERGELELWMLLWLSIVTSAAFVFNDDGKRALAVSYVSLAVFFALGFADPTPVIITTLQKDNERWLSRYGVSCFALAAVLFFGIPWFAYRMSPMRHAIAGDLVTKTNEAVVFGGRRMSGFLVVPDGVPLRSDVPTVDFSTFSAILEQSGIEQYQGLVNPHAPETPFGFVYTPMLAGRRNVLYIVPPEVMERKEVLAWRFDLEEWQRKPPYGPYWYLVTHAEPLRY